MTRRLLRWVLPTLIVLFWLLRQNAANEQRSTLIADVLWLEQSVNFHLEGNAEQFQQLALDLALTPEKNKDALFRLRSQHLLKNNPELQQLLWLDRRLNGRANSASRFTLKPINSRIHLSLRCSFQSSRTANTEVRWSACIRSTPY